MKTQFPFRKSVQTGYSLLTTLILVAAGAVLLGGTLTRTMTGAKLNDRNNSFIVGRAAAEAATEKVLARMQVDFASGGEQALSNNIDYYRTQMVPSTNENTYWANFQFSDAMGNANRTYVQRTTTNPNPPYVALLTQYPGLNAFAATYRVLSNVKPVGNNYGSYNMTNAVQQDLQMAEIPVFQFAIFYNGLLEFSDCAPLTVNGRVHCNTNIYVGTPSPNTLTFNYFVTSSGVITNPAWFGFTQSQWTGVISYNGSPAPGYGTGEPVLTLPIGTNYAGSGSQQILFPPPNGESTTNPISPQRFYNKADIQLFVTDSNISLTLKNTMYDASPTNFSYTNGMATNTAAWTNWAKIAITNSSTGWLSTNITNFYDQREGRYIRLTQIDIAKLGTWMATNVACSNEWAGSNPFDGIIYIQDTRTTNSSYMDAVRLINGAAITNGTYTNTLPQGMWQSGLTVATPNPLYILGNYNCPNPAYAATTNTTLSRPCSVLCDALTILSTNWNDSLSAGSYGSRATPPTNTTVNTAIITGNVPSTDATDTGFSGGVHNLPRLLENWGSKTLTLNTSMICLYGSSQATQQFQKPGVYYNAPSRQFYFDQNFNSSAGLPPGTPQVDRLIRATWSTPPPGVTNYTPSPTLSFVPK